MDHGAMDHGAMGHGAMDHGAMDHGAMDHGAMNHGAMDPGAMDPGAMDPGAMDHGAMDHGAMDHGGRPSDHSAMPGTDHGAAAGTSQGHAMPADDAAGVGTALPAGDKPAPAPPLDHYADRDYGAGTMAASRAALPADHGGGTFSQFLLNIAEYQVHRGGDGYRWDGSAWFGGDIHRLTVKSEGEGVFGARVEAAEAQALYSRALDPYWNVQAGLRYDFRPDPSRAYATVGVEGLAPYWFDVEAALFLSDEGDLVGRAEGYHDMRLTQRLMLQPRIELDFAAQDMRAQDVGSGLSSAELGLRLRYEIRRETAPYVGVSWDRKVGDTARLARAAGERVGITSLVVGVRAWF